MGTSYIVAPSSQDIETALNDESSDQNIQIFYGLCETLFKPNHGLVCSSACNTETMKTGTLQCYYLQPSEKGPMLLRRLAGSEEILPLPDISHTSSSAIPMEIKDSVEASLSKIALKDYNPPQHERGSPSKLNSLVKDSLQFGSISPASAMEDPGHQNLFTEPWPSSFRGQKANMFSNQSKEKVCSSVTEEWEKLLIIDEMTDSFLSPVASRWLTSPRDARCHLQRDIWVGKPQRILERLEAPKPKRQWASKPMTPIVPSNVVSTQMKKPLLPFEPSNVVSTQMEKPLLSFEPSASQPMKPTFNRLRRKLNS